MKLRHDLGDFQHLGLGPDRVCFVGFDLLDAGKVLGCRTHACEMRVDLGADFGPWSSADGRRPCQSSKSAATAGASRLKKRRM